MEGPDMDPQLQSTLETVDLGLAACFTVECVLKIVTFSFTRYIKARTLYP